MLGAGLFARLSKYFPSMPKSAVPWIALFSGAILMLLKTWLLDGLPLWPDAVTSALAGMAAGASAVGGHEALKPLLVRMFGPNVAKFILGKLPDKAAAVEPGDPDKKTAASAVIGLVMLSVSGLAGCSALAQLLPVIAKVAPVAAQVSQYLQMVEASGEDWFETHPDPEAEAVFTAALDKSRGALSVIKELSKAGASADRNELDRAFVALEHAYRELYALVESKDGLLDAAKLLGASGEGGEGGEGDGIPTPDDFAEHVRGAYEDQSEE